MLAASLRDDALAVLGALPRHIPLDFSTLCQALERKFGGVQGTHVTTFRVRTQRQKESITEFGFDLQRLAALAFPDCPMNSVQKLVVSQFLEGLRDINTKVMVQMSRPGSLDEALRTALEVEASLGSSRSKNPRPFFLVEQQNSPVQRNENRRRIFRRRPGRNGTHREVTAASSMPSTQPGNEIPSMSHDTR